MISLGIDVGGTNIKVAAMNEKKELLEVFETTTDVEKGYGLFIRKISNIISDMRKKYKQKLAGCCFAIAGDVDSNNGVLRYAPNLSGWKNKYIKKDIENLSNLKCIVQNDANMAAWGCFIFDLKRKFKNVAVFTLGTGIGGGIILDGKLYCGSSSSAGEFGHMVINYRGEKCNCGNYGCLEAYCSTYSLKKNAIKKIKNLSDYIKKYSMEEKELSPKLLYNAALKGDPVALKLWSEYGVSLGTGIGNVILSFNPDRVVLCGGVSRAARFFMPYVKKRLCEFGIKAPIKFSKIIVSRHYNVGVMGAAAFVFEKR
ncbi:MAG: ROK family protein [Elusimicrobiota bacterium]